TIFVDTFAASSFAVSAQPETVSACDSTEIPIAVHSGFCDSLVFNSTRILNDSLHFISVPSGGWSQHRRPSSGEDDTLWLQYKPRGHAEDRSYSISISGRLMPSNIAVDTVLSIHLTAVAPSP